MSADGVPREKLGVHRVSEVARLTPALLFTADEKGNLDFVNERWAELTGAPSDSLLGTGWMRRVSALDLPGVVKQWRDHILNREPFDVQFRLRRADATYRWVEVRAVPELLADGEALRWFGAGVDIDAQRRAIAAMEFLVESGATVATAQDVETILSRMADASLMGIADVAIFDLLADGRWRRVTVTSAQVPPHSLRTIQTFPAPQSGEVHPIARAMDQARSIHVPEVDESFILENIGDPIRREAWRVTGIRSLVAVPLLARGELLGALTLLRTITDVPFDAADVRVAEEIGHRAGLAIQNVRLNDIATYNARATEVFADIGAALSESLGLQETLEAVLRVLIPACADWGSIETNDESTSKVAAAFPSDGPRDRADERRVVVPLPGLPDGDVSLTVCVTDAARSFDRQADSFFAEVARRIAPAIANARIYERERRIASSFQNAALPASLPEIEGFTFDAVYEAGRSEATVGGDWYDAFVLVDGRIVVSVGDVTGSGLHAAVTMSNVRQAIRGVAHVHADPDVMLQAADRALRSEAPDRFVTAFVGVIDPISNTLTYKSAGHLPALLRLRDGKCTSLVSHGLPLGLRSDDDPPSQIADFPIDSLLVLYTDGLVEATHDLLQGERRLAEIVSDAATARAVHPARTIHDAMLQESGSKDDVAILTVAALARRPGLRWDIDPRDRVGTQAARAAIVNELARRDYPHRLRPSAELILAELIGNLARYAPGEAELLLEWNGHQPVLHVRDRGPGFEFAAKLPPDIYSESGRGLFMISSFALDFQVTRRLDGGSHARVVLNA